LRPSGPSSATAPPVSRAVKRLVEIRDQEAGKLHPGTVKSCFG